MKKKLIFVILCVLMMIMASGCNNQNRETVNSLSTTNITALDKAIEDSTNSETTSTDSLSRNTVANDTSQLVTDQKSTNYQVTAKPDEQKSSGQTTSKNATATQKQTTKKQETTKPNTTKKPTTTKETTTVTTTVKSNKLTKSDIDWVQSQAHAYIKSKGISANSNVSSFSYRTSSYNYTDRNKLLSKIKETIDFEYDECINSGWKKVDMYVSVSADGDGDYWLIVMYG